VGLELVDSVLRYAALEREKDAHRLLRLGRCDFDFDAAAWLLKDESPSPLETMAKAIGEVLDDIEAVHFHLVVHPPACTVFSAPIAADADAAERNERLHWEAGQLMGLDEEIFKIVVHPLRSETHEELGPVDWYYVMALERVVYENLVSLLEHAREQVVPHFSGSVQAASAVAVRSVQTSSVDEEVTPTTKLLVGQYSDRTEYAITRTTEGSTSCYWEGGSIEDATYAVAQLGESVGETLRSIDEVLLYGPSPREHELDELTELLGEEPRRFNPFEALDIETGRVADEFSYWEYVPSVGVTI
jgi:hypothetical protein